MTRYTSRVLGIALCGFASLTVVRASCFTPQTFGQSGYYVNFPPEYPATSESIIGRFWRPGAYQTTNQGDCDESRWLIPCNGDCPSVTTTPAFWIYGEIGSNECQVPSGCTPSDELILLLEERAQGFGTWSSLFAIARVDDSEGLFLYDFSRVGRDIGLTSIPKPKITNIEHIGSIDRVHFRFEDPAPGFYGLPGVPATGTITAIKLYSRVAATPDPPERSGWTFRARFPYIGGVTTGTADFGNVCPGGGYHYSMAAALEFDGGQSETYYLSAPLRAGCALEIDTGASRVSEVGADALHMSRDASGALALSWGAVCFPLGAACSVYEGTIGDWTSHAPRGCAAFGTTAVLTPSPDSSYYLVVPYASNWFTSFDLEGSYGLRSDGTERNPSTAACAPQMVQECP